MTEQPCQVNDLSSRACERGTRGCMTKHYKLFRHYKGELYQLIMEANQCDSGERVVVYRSMETGLVWVRLHSEFFGVVPNPDVLVDRFTPVEA